MPHISSPTPQFPLHLPMREEERLFLTKSCVANFKGFYRNGYNKKVSHNVQELFLLLKKLLIPLFRAIPIETKGWSPRKPATKNKKPKKLFLSTSQSA